MKGFDVSENNGYIDFDAAVAQGYEFVFVRVSYGCTEDSMFRDNVARAHAAGLKVGAYVYSYALNPSRAVQEALFARDVIEEVGCLLELPVFFDMEDADGYKARHNFDFSAENITAICNAFLDNIGLSTGVYASEDWLDNYINWRPFAMKGHAVWNAAWMNGFDPEPSNDNSTDEIKGFVWQYTARANISGKELDGDWIYDE